MISCFKPSFSPTVAYLSVCLMFVFPAYNQSAMQVMSFNVRYDNPNDGENAWPKRVSLVRSVLQEVQPDIIGFQEVLNHQLADLITALPAYEWYGVGRDDGAKAGEYGPIFYKSDRYTLLRKGTQWLSETPDQPGLGWDAACNRILTWVELEDQTSGDTVLILNTHLDHRGEIARQESVKQLLALWQVQTHTSKKLLLGDFNSDPESRVIKTLTRSSDLADAYQMVDKPLGPLGTFQGFGSVSDTARIDYIFFNPQSLQAQKLSHINLQKGTLFLSDHWPVLAEFK
ncbi:MAG: endonuclease/exonuclease/phosphatase family protein [Bacteroidota bacterium]